jgi:hypothetical protein
MTTLYAIYWNYNGTNDLVVVDGSDNVIDSLPEALFGIDVFSGEPSLLRDGNIYDFNEFDAENDDFVICCKIDQYTAMARRACSPIDIEGAKTIDFLNKYLQVAA